MEENKLIKYQNDQLQRIGNKIILTNKLLNDTSIGIQKILHNYNYLGNNEKNICILIKEPSAEYILDTTLKQIVDILKACKLELTDVAIFNVEKEKIKIDDLISTLSPNVILLFDINSNDIHFTSSLNFNEILIYHGCKILLALSLESLFQENNIDTISRKKELWESLKIIFDLYPLA